MRSFVLFLLVLALVTPASAQHLEHDEGPILTDVVITDIEPPAPTPVPTASPAPTPTLEPRCEDAGPLVPCRARQDPAAVLNQRVTAVEQGLAQLRQQAAQAFQEQAARIDALTPKKK